MDSYVRSVEHATTPEQSVPEVLILDMDRMLGDIDLVMERVYYAAEQIGVNPQHIRAEREDTEGKKSFDVLAYVKTHIDSNYPDQPELFDDFKCHFVTGRTDGSDKGILYPDAQRFLQRLSANNVPHVVMTYGDQEWQSLKMMAAGIPLGYIVTDTKDKGPIIAGFRSDDDHFTMHNQSDGIAYTAPVVTFIDDKADAFKSFPQDEAYRGFWIQRGELLDHQRGSVPGNVQIISSLDQLIINEQGEVSITDDSTLVTKNNRVPEVTAKVYVPLSRSVEIVLPEEDADLPAGGNVLRFRLRQIALGRSALAS